MSSYQGNSGRYFSSSRGSDNQPSHTILAQKYRGRGWRLGPFARVYHVGLRRFYTIRVFLSRNWKVVHFIVVDNTGTSRSIPWSKADNKNQENFNTFQTSNFHSTENWILLSPIFALKFSAHRHFGFHDVIRLPNYSTLKIFCFLTIAATEWRRKIQNGGTEEICTRNYTKIISNFWNKKNSPDFTAIRWRFQTSYIVVKSCVFSPWVINEIKSSTTISFSPDLLLVQL